MKSLVSLVVNQVLRNRSESKSFSDSHLVSDITFKKQIQATQRFLHFTFVLELHYILVLRKLLHRKTYWDNLGMEDLPNSLGMTMWKTEATVCLFWALYAMNRRERPNNRVVLTPGAHYKYS